MGANANCMQWDKGFISQLVANDYHVVRFDNRDVGKSTWFGKESALNKYLRILPNFLFDLFFFSREGSFNATSASASPYATHLRRGGRRRRRAVVLPRGRPMAGTMDLDTVKITVSG